MKISEKLETLSEDAALDLLAANGKLVKRPFVLTGETGLVGFKEEEWKKVFYYSVISRNLIKRKGDNPCFR